MWNAMRCALLGPMPGSRPNSSIRSWIAPSYTPYLHPGQAEPAEPRRHRPHLLLLKFPRRLGGVVQRREHQILQRLDVVRVDRLRVDLHADGVTRTGDGDRD